MKRIFAGLAGATLLLAAGVMPASAQNKTFLTMDVLSAGSTSGQFGIAFSQIIQKNLPIEIQTSSGKPATKSAVDAAMGKVDLFTSAPAINYFMQKKLAMYAKVDDAPELNKKLRNIVTFPVGPNQFVTYADSGIVSMQDFKGKIVYVGPPGSASTKLTTDMIEAVTGLKAGEDYETPRFDWQSAETAFTDRQMDVFIAFSELPSPMIHNDLAHAPPTSRSQHGNEAMQLAIEMNFIEDRSAITFESTIMIVQPHSGQKSDEPVEDA